MDALTNGTRIWNNGDMANAGHFGTVTSVITNRWGTHYEITPDGDSASERKPYTIPAVMLSPEFKGHSGTRIVTETAYRAYYERPRAEFLKALGR